MIASIEIHFSRTGKQRVVGLDESGSAIGKSKRSERDFFSVDTDSNRSYAEIFKVIGIFLVRAIVRLTIDQTKNKRFWYQSAEKVVLS